MSKLWALGAVLLLAGRAGADAGNLEHIRAEPSAEKRADQALDNMDSCFKQAQDLLHQGGDPAKIQAAIEEMTESAEVSLESLRATGKKPGKLTKQYKRGEVKTRELLRKLDSFIAALNFDDRPPVEKARGRIQVVQDEFLMGVMSKN
jgi:hypothetical protein